jgi:hypothetical protein
MVILQYKKTKPKVQSTTAKAQNGSSIFSACRLPRASIFNFSLYLLVTDGVVTRRPTSNVHVQAEKGD